MALGHLVYAAMSTRLEPLVMVCALAKNRVIGAANGIPWNLPEDRKHFVAVTRGHSVIMGRGTWDSIGKPLPKRRNIVVSRNPALELEGAEVVPSLAAAIALARTADDAPRVIGGGQLYAEALPLATRLYLTELPIAYEGDTFFPELDPREWHCSEERQTNEAIYRTLDRVTR
jgi:dihydrofolate reductase